MKHHSIYYLKATIIGLTALYILLGIAGGVLTFSPVPYWDMWGGYVDFFNGLQEGHYSRWWAQHNEHRIVLSRLLFWVDFKVFNGSLIFLIIVNYLLAASIFFSFFYIIKSSFTQENTKNLQFILITIVCIFSFSWIQKENLIWGFQSQFFFAQVIPFLAFYLLYLSTQKPHSHWPFLSAICLGITSIGTMANGILALPIMVFLGIALNIKWQKIALLAVFSGITLFLYFIDYQSIETHGSLSTALKNHPIELIQFVLTYIGLPFYFMAKKSILAAQLAGSIFILSCVFFAYKTLLDPRRYPLQIMLLFFIAYIGATALGTAGGRSIFGTEFALSSRYATPSLMAWSSMALIIFSLYKDKLIAWKYKAYLILLIPALLFPYQFRALHSDYLEANFERMISALALELNIHDSNQLSFIYPTSTAVLSFSEQAREKDWFIFYHPKIKDVASVIGQHYKGDTEVSCMGTIESVDTIEDVQNYVRISGWLYAPEASDVPEKVFIVDKANKKIIGYAITGERRKDLAKEIDKDALYSGFKGYALASYRNKNILLVGADPGCQLSTTLNAP